MRDLLGSVYDKGRSSFDPQWNMPVTEPCIPKDLRRRSLALTLLQRHVRTETICEWTGLTRTLVNRLRKAHQQEFPDYALTRPPGPSPRKLREFLRSARKRNEAAAAAGLCLAYGVIPKQPVPDAIRKLPSVARGEHLCAVYDLFLALVPSASLTVEQLIFLLMSLATREHHDIASCLSCRASILIDPLGSARRLCMHCAGDDVYDYRRSA